MAVKWVPKYHLWQSGKYLVVPRMDEDGIDIFFAIGEIVDGEFKGKTVARYCAEGYWAFESWSDEERHVFEEIVWEILEKRIGEGDEFAEESIESLRSML